MANKSRESPKTSLIPSKSPKLANMSRFQYQKESPTRLPKVQPKSFRVLATTIASLQARLLAEALQALGRSKLYHISDDEEPEGSEDEMEDDEEEDDE